MSYGFADVLDDGRRVIGQFGAPTIQFGDATPLFVPVWLMFVRACQDSTGRAWAVGKGNSNGHAYLIDEHGVIRDLGATAGNQCVALNVAGSYLVVAVQTYGGSSMLPALADVYWINPETLEGGIGQLHKFKQTSQGFSDVDSDGTLHLYDPLQRVLVGRGVHFLSERPALGLSIAQDDVTGCVIARGSQIGHVSQGDCLEPHLSQNGQFWICRSASTVLSGPVPNVIPPLEA